MKTPILLSLLISCMRLSAQDSTSQKLRDIIEDSKQFFTQTKGRRTLETDSTPIYQSKIILPGTKENTIKVSEYGSKWGYYFANISDSTSSKDAKKLAEYWRTLVESNTEGYTEDKTKRVKKTVMGNVMYGYVFIRQDGSYEDSIAITYGRRSASTWSVFILIGRQSVL